MEKIIEIYYADKKVNTVVVDMDSMSQTATIKNVETHTDDVHLSFWGDMPENCIECLNYRSYLSQFNYYTSGETSGYILYTAVDILLQTHGLSYVDKYWLKEAVDKSDYDTVLKQCPQTIKRYYGVQRRKFEGNSVTTYFESTYKHLQTLASVIATNTLKAMGIWPVLNLISYTYDSVTFENVCKEGEYLISAYDILLRNYDYAAFSFAKKQPILTYKNLVKLLSDAVGFDVLDYLSRLLFLDSLLLNEGHYIANIYFICNASTGQYRAAPYMTYSHILGTAYDVDISKKADCSFSRTICQSFDVIGLLMSKQGIVFPKRVVVPLKSLINFKLYDSVLFNIEDIKNLCAIIGYRYQQLTGFVIDFDDEM